MTPWPRAAAAYPQTLECDMLSCTSIFRALLKWHVFDQIFLKLGFNPRFSSARFSLRHSIFAQMNGCHIFEVETQNRIIREPHFLPVRDILTRPTWRKTTHPGNPDARDILTLGTSWRSGHPDAKSSKLLRSAFFLFLSLFRATPQLRF